MSQKCTLKIEIEVEIDYEFYRSRLETAHVEINHIEKFGQRITLTPDEYNQVHDELTDHVFESL